MSSGDQMKYILTSLIVLTVAVLISATVMQVPQLQGIILVSLCVLVWSWFRTSYEKGDK
jgi:uncharacterized membrane protein YbaN (DUF454 family)